MRPIPTSKHHWAVLVLLAVTVANTVLTCRQTDITGDQANMLAEVHKRGDGLLYPHDGVFADDSLGAPWRGRQPAWQWLLDRAVGLGGDDPLNGFRLLGAGIAALYLVFMYLLIYRQTHSTTAATVVALLSTAIFSVKRPYWGVGPMFSVTPATLVVAFTPLVATMFIGARQRWRIIAVFAFTGLLANIHLSSAVNLTIVLLATLVALGRGRPGIFAKAAVSLMAVVVGAAPAALHAQSVLAAGEAAWPLMPMSDVAAMLNLARIQVLFPGALVEVLWWLPLAGALAIPSGIILFRAGRYRIREQAVWVWFLAAAFGVALLLQGFSQFVGQSRGTPPPIIEFFDALKLAMLPLYVFFAQAAVHLYRQTRSHRGWVRAILLIFAVVYLGSSYNTRTLRHLVQDSIAQVARSDAPAEAGDESARTDDPPPAGWDAVLRGDTHRGHNDEARNLAEWLGRNDHTPPDALLITNRREVRPFARRSVACTPADIRTLYHFAPARLTTWTARLKRQREVLGPPEAVRADADTIARFADRIRREDRIGDVPVYVILATDKAPPSGGRLAEVLPPAKLWGEHWRLFRVLQSDPASRPASTTAPGLE